MAETWIGLRGQAAPDRLRGALTCRASTAGLGRGSPCRRLIVSPSESRLPSQATVKTRSQRASATCVLPGRSVGRSRPGRSFLPLTGLTIESSGPALVLRRSKARRADRPEGQPDPRRGGSKALPPVESSSGRTWRVFASRSRSRSTSGFGFGFDQAARRADFPTPLGAAAGAAASSLSVTIDSDIGCA